MNVFVYEYCCARPAGADAAAEALRAEGRAMLSAVMEDLAAVPGVAAGGLLARDLPPVPFPAARFPPGNEKHLFCARAAKADWTLVIAPEIDGILEQRAAWVAEAGGRLLGPDL